MPETDMVRIPPCLTLSGQVFAGCYASFNPCFFSQRDNALIKRLTRMGQKTLFYREG